MIYIERPGNIFDVEDAEFFAHACNCYGVWGAGVAYTLRSKFPASHKEESERCRRDTVGLIGTASISGKVISLYTSKGFGVAVDSEQEILQNTRKALEHLESLVQPETVIVSPRFNSGLFGVPWERTRDVLLDVMQDCDIIWEVRYL